MNKIHYMDKEQIRKKIDDLEKDLKKLKDTLGIGDFSSNVVFTKNHIHSPTSSLFLQNAFARIENPLTVTIASPGVVTSQSHGMAVNQPFTFATTGALPTGITAGTTYYVISTGFGVNSFQFSATLGGGAVNTSGSQSGTHSLIYFKFVTAKIKFGNIEGTQDAGGIFAVDNETTGPSGYSEVDWLHATAEVGIRIYGQEVGGGGRVVELFVGSQYFKVVDGDGSGNYIETDLKIDFTPNVGSIFEFTADATAAGTYAGRVPITVGGVTKYLHYFNA